MIQERPTDMPSAGKKRRRCIIWMASLAHERHKMSGGINSNSKADFPWERDYHHF
ncbi:hypothetical protein AtEden1_Chr3g0174731 [Arabidopsis thaliana]